MPASIIVWDIETVPDLRGFAAVFALLIGERTKPVEGGFVDGQELRMALLASLIIRRVRCLLALESNSFWLRCQLL